MRGERESLESPLLSGIKNLFLPALPCLLFFFTRSSRNRSTKHEVALLRPLHNSKPIYFVPYLCYLRLITGIPPILAPLNMVQDPEKLTAVQEQKRTKTAS
jgi:hypothetical protein